MEIESDFVVLDKQPLDVVVGIHRDRVRDRASLVKHGLILAAERAHKVKGASAVLGTGVRNVLADLLDGPLDLAFPRHFRFPFPSIRSRTASAWA